VRADSSWLRLMMEEVQWQRECQQQLQISSVDVEQKRGAHDRGAHLRLSNQSGRRSARANHPEICKTDDSCQMICNGKNSSRASTSHPIRVNPPFSEQVKNVLANICHNGRLLMPWRMLVTSRKPDRHLCDAHGDCMESLANLPRLPAQDPQEEFRPQCNEQKPPPNRPQYETSTALGVVLAMLQTTGRKVRPLAMLQVLAMLQKYCADAQVQKYHNEIDGSMWRLQMQGCFGTAASMQACAWWRAERN
jgi:hypothetical protein